MTKIEVPRGTERITMWKIGLMGREGRNRQQGRGIKRGRGLERKKVDRERRRVSKEDVKERKGENGGRRK